MKISRPVLYSLLGVIAIAALLMTGGDNKKPNAASTATKRVASKKADVYLKEDYDAAKDPSRFQAVNLAGRNAFKPLIARRMPDAMSGGLAGEGGVPSMIAGEGWVYTGMATVDNVPMALLENTRTQDGVFLKQGERWNGALVKSIKPEELMLVSREGVTFSIKLQSPELVVGGSNAAGTMPVRPQLRGSIGQGLAIEPDRSVAVGGNGRNRERNMGAMDQGTGVQDED
jgi:hypothetical protein